MTTEQPEAMPEVEDLQQENDLRNVVVPVRVADPVLTHELPSRVGVIQVAPLSTSAVKVLYSDLKRKKAQLVCASAFLIARNKSGEFALWPANVPLVLTTSDELWAKVSSSTADLTVVSEVWAD